MCVFSGLKELGGGGFGIFILFFSSDLNIYTQHFIQIQPICLLAFYPFISYLLAIESLSRLNLAWYIMPTPNLKPDRKNQKRP